MGSKNIFEQTGLSVVTTQEAMKDRQDLATASIKDNYKSPMVYIRTGDKLEAVRLGLVPEAYMNCEFDIEKVKENQIEQIKTSARKFFVKRFEDYRDVTSGIISTIISNKIPNQSYIIGAPNGFGKTSFVNTCIIRLHAQGRNCTPYISLSDLAQAKLTNEKRLLSGIGSKEIYKGDSIDAKFEDYDSVVFDGFTSSTYDKKPINIIDRYSWSEYMNCAVLFCYFTDVRSKVLESEMLKTAITVRGAKGLPTIAMISTSLDPYKNDKYLAEYVWNEILAYNNSESSYDRVKHISCYKDYNAPLKIASREN